MLEEVHVTEHHDTGEEEGGRVGLAVNRDNGHATRGPSQTLVATVSKLEVTTYPCPAISGAEPWTASKIDASFPMLPEGVSLCAPGVDVSGRARFVDESVQSRLTRVLRSNQRTCPRECHRKAVVRTREMSL